MHLEDERCRIRRIRNRCTIKSLLDSILDSCFFELREGVVFVIDALSGFEVALQRDDVAFVISRVYVIVPVSAARPDRDRSFSVEFQNRFRVVIDTFPGACPGKNDLDFDGSLERHDEFQTIVVVWEDCVGVEWLTIQCCFLDLTEDFGDSGCDCLELINACHEMFLSRTRTVSRAHFCIVLTQCMNSEILGRIVGFEYRCDGYFKIFHTVCIDKLCVTV